MFAIGLGIELNYFPRTITFYWTIDSRLIWKFIDAAHHINWYHKLDQLKYNGPFNWRKHSLHDNQYLSWEGERRLKSNIKKWNEIKSYPKLPLLCTERRERFSIRTFLYRPATIVITLITRTPQPHHKTGYHSESLLIKSKHSLGFNFNFSECTLDGAVILWLEKHIWNHFFHCAEHAGAQMV